MDYFRCRHPVSAKVQLYICTHFEIYGKILFVMHTTMSLLNDNVTHYVILYAYYYYCIQTTRSPKNENLTGLQIVKRSILGFSPRGGYS